MSEGLNVTMSRGDVNLGEVKLNDGEKMSERGQISLKYLCGGGEAGSTMFSEVRVYMETVGYEKEPFQTNSGIG